MLTPFVCTFTFLSSLFPPLEVSEVREGVDDQIGVRGLILGQRVKVERGYSIIHSNMIKKD